MSLRFHTEDWQAIRDVLTDTYDAHRLTSLVSNNLSSYVEYPDCSIRTDDAIIQAVRSSIR